jgi:endonuclease/exonuclease/phosphatase family metal-dependent hydrolase
VVRGHPGDRERLGYLFDSSRYDLDGLVGELVIPPDELGLGHSTLNQQFAKTPYAVSFRSVHDTSRAFILVTVHIVWGDRPALRAVEANRLAGWIEDWAGAPHVWDPDIFALGDFNADRITNPRTGQIDPLYESFARILTIPEKMHAFPRTIFPSGKNKHYDMITWHEPHPGQFGLTYQDCGYFDTDTALRDHFGLSTTAFSYRISDHYPLWARFTC